MKFNYRDASRARKMKRRQLPDKAIISFFSGKYTAAGIDNLVEGLRDRNAKYRKENCSRIALTYEIEAENRPPIPVEVIEQREFRAMLRPRTTTALLCGDPLPGFSALDLRLV